MTDDIDRKIAGLTEAQPVLFLDFDGVICLHSAYNASGQTDWSDSACCDRVRALAERFGLRIVVSSSWRMHWERTMDLLHRRDLARFLHDIAPATSFANRVSPGGIELANVRGQEIENWLIENGHRPYLILDDDSDMLSHQFPRFVRCPTYEGFGTAEYIEAGRKLTRQGLCARLQERSDG